MPSTLFTINLITEKEYDVKSSRGNQFLGGRDFDEKIVEHFIQKIQKTHPHFKDNVQMMTKLRTECEDLKLKLTRYETASITLKDNDGSVLLKDQMTRGCFEELNMKLFKETLNMVEDALDEAKMLISMIDEVVLVGGSSRIPKIKEMMKSYFEGLDLSCQINPDEAIAMGAAILAAKLSGNPSKDLKGFKLSDVTPLALGVYQEPTDCYGNRLRGTMLKIIPRNSKIPIIEEEQFETVFDNQTEWTIEIFQGESEHTSKNTMLGNFSIKNIPPRPAGKEKINLYFELDCNGILLATAQLASNIENSVVMSVDPNKHTAKMTKKEIEHMREVAKAYDLQERERQRNMKMKQEIETSP